MTWQLSEPMLLDANDGAFETCYEHKMLQERLVNNQAGPPLPVYIPQGQTLLRARAAPKAAV